MKYGKIIIVASLAVALLGGIQGAMAEQARIELHPTAWTQLNLKGADKELASKIAAQITANPANAEALVSALVAANPEHAAAIVRAAIVTLPSQSVAFTVATLTAVHDSSKTAPIVNAALRVAPRDSKTVADLQSLVTRNWTPQNNTQQNFSQNQQKFDNQNQENNNPVPPPVERVVGGGASPS